MVRVESEMPSQTTPRESTAVNSSLRRTSFQKGRSPRICLCATLAPNPHKMQILEMTRVLHDPSGLRPPPLRQGRSCVFTPPLKKNTPPDSVGCANYRESRNPIASIKSVVLLPKIRTDHGGNEHCKPDGYPSCQCSNSGVPGRCTLNQFLQMQ